MFSLEITHSARLSSPFLIPFLPLIIPSASLFPASTDEICLHSSSEWVNEMINIQSQGINLPQPVLLVKRMLCQVFHAVNELSHLRHEFLILLFLLLNGS